MSSLVRKNLASLISSNKSFCRKSPVSLALSIHFFSTSPNIYDLLRHKHHFSHKVASTVEASKPAKSESPEKADLVLTFLKQSGFSGDHLENIVKNNPRVLSANVEDIIFKIKTIQDVGLSPQDVSKMISSNQTILQVSAKNKIISSLALLRGLLGSDYYVARVLRRSGRVLVIDLEKSLMPNIEFLKSCGIPMERIFWLLHGNPRSFLIKTDVMKKSVDKAIEMGFNPSSNMFVHALRRIASMGKETWEVKWQAFRNLGFSDSEVSTMFKKEPTLFHKSTKKVENIKELLLATGKYNLSSIVNNPASLGCSIEKRFKPRLRILGILESKNLIKKWPGLGSLYKLSDDQFSERYIMPFSDEVGDVEGKRVLKLQLSA